jgi:hypothetical protein
MNGGSTNCHKKENVHQTPLINTSGKNQREINLFTLILKSQFVEKQEESSKEN